MQNKGLIKLFAVLFGLVSLYQLSFTFFANKVEDSAKEYSKENVKDNNGRELARYERKYLDSVANKEVLNLGVAQYTYNDIREKEMNLGLDLKGGINAILQVSVKDILIGLSNNSKNTVFTEALAKADEDQKDSQENYLDLFYNNFVELSANSVKLSDPSIFGTKSLRDKIDFNKTNEQVKSTLQEEINTSINTAFEVLRSRIDKFGVVQPNIQRIGTSGRIQVELPGAKDIDRVQKLLQSTAELQFWEVYTNADVQNFFFAANAKVAELLKDDSTTEVAKDSTKADSIDDLLGESADSTKVATQKNLFTYLYPNVAQNQQQITSLVANARVQDTAKVNSFLANNGVRALLPANLNMLSSYGIIKLIQVLTEQTNLLVYTP